MADTNGSYTFYLFVMCFLGRLHVGIQTELLEHIADALEDSTWNVKSV